MDQEPLYIEHLQESRPDYNHHDHSSLCTVRHMAQDLIQVNENYQPLSLKSIRKIFQDQKRVMENIGGSLVEMRIVTGQNSKMIETMLRKTETLEQKVASGQRTSNIMQHRFAEELTNVKRRLANLEEIARNNSQNSSERAGGSSGRSFGETQAGVVTRCYDGNSTEDSPEAGVMLSGFRRHSSRGHLKLMPAPPSGSCFENLPKEPLEAKRLPGGQIERNERGRYVCPHCKKDFSANYVLRHVEKGICQVSRNARQMTQAQLQFNNTNYMI